MVLGNGFIVDNIAVSKFNWDTNKRMIVATYSIKKLNFHINMRVHTLQHCTSIYETSKKCNVSVGTFWRRTGKRSAELCVTFDQGVFICYSQYFSYSYIFKIQKQFNLILRSKNPTLELV